MSVTPIGTKFVPYPNTLDGKWLTYGQTDGGKVVFFITDTNPSYGFHGFQRLERTAGSLEEGEVFYGRVNTMRDLLHEPRWSDNKPEEA